MSRISKSPRMVALEALTTARVCDCRTHIVLSANTTLGPHPDTDRMTPVLFAPLSRGVGIDCALFDATLRGLIRAVRPRL